MRRSALDDLLLEYLDGEAPDTEPTTQPSPPSEPVTDMPASVEVVSSPNR